MGQAKEAASKKKPAPKTIEALNDLNRWFKATHKILTADFPKEAYSPDTSRGFELTSIKAAYVIERLNEAFGLCGHGWTYRRQPFQISESGEVLAEVTLWYRLPDGTWSEPICNVGGKRQVRNNLTDARKSAITDAITKIASFLGVGHKAFKGLVKVNEPKKATNVSQPAKSAGNKASDDQIKMIFGLAKQKKIKTEVISKKIRDRFNLESLTELNKTQASQVITSLKKMVN